MSFNDAAVDTVFDKVVSYALASNRFELVNGHEPKSAPGNGLTCAVWVQDVRPVRTSGLAFTSGVLRLQARIYTNFLGEPADLIDPNIISAASDLMGALSGDFDLGGDANVRAVDLLGMSGEMLSAQAGYIEIDRKMYRVMTINIPIIINDMWLQAGSESIDEAGTSTLTLQNLEVFQNANIGGNLSVLGNITESGRNVISGLIPSGDTTGVTDQAAIQALENLGAQTIYFGPGTFWVTGLTKQSNSVWQGSGRYGTIIKLADAANTDVIRGASFSSLTLSGSTGGISGWGIRDLTIDGNKANQSGTSCGLRVYGYDFDLYNVSIMNCLSDGIYSEWSASSSVPGTNNDAMEARLYGVKIHDNNGNGWHNRGPHDSRAYDLTIFRHTNTTYGFWSETSGGRTVAAGSNGADVATFAGAGVLNVNTTLGYPTSSISSTQGALSVVTSGGTAVITYTGTTATSFTGCTTISGSGTLSTGGSVTMVGGGYSAPATLLSGAHVWGDHLYGYLLDAQTHLTGCVGEGAPDNGAEVLVRAGDCSVVGGILFTSSSNPKGAGLQIGDAANAVSGIRVDTKIINFAGVSAATAAINIVNDGGSNAVDANIYQPTGTAVFGTTSNNSRYRVFSGGGTTANIAGISVAQDHGVIRHFAAPASNTAWRVTAGGGSDILNVNTNQARAEVNNGYELRVYSDNFTTTAIRLLGASGHIGFAPPASHAPTIAAAAGNGTTPPTPTVLGGSSDVNGQAQFGSGTGPTAGAQVTVTFGTVFTATPIIILTPANDATSALIPYVSTPGTSSFAIGFHTAPAAGQGASTYLVNWIAIARPN